MALQSVEEYIEIRRGGIDHMGAHHTNELAQSECAIGHRWGITWMHRAFAEVTKSPLGPSVAGLQAATSRRASKQRTVTSIHDAALEGSPTT